MLSHQSHQKVPNFGLFPLGAQSLRSRHQAIDLRPKAYEVGICIPICHIEAPFGYLRATWLDDVVRDKFCRIRGRSSESFVQPPDARPRIRWVDLSPAGGKRRPSSLMQITMPESRCTAEPPHRVSVRFAMPTISTFPEPPPGPVTAVQF